MVFSKMTKYQALLSIKIILLAGLKHTGVDLTGLAVGLSIKIILLAGLKQNRIQN